MQTRLHIRLGDKGTTVTLETVLVVMLAVKLGRDPSDHKAVREWLQEHLPARFGVATGIETRLSSNARIMIIEAIADESLSAAWDHWVIDRFN